MRNTRGLIYLGEDANTVKDSFVAVADALGDDFDGTLADVGCAAGAFPNYLSRRLPGAKITGMEYLDETVEAARKSFPEIAFIQGDVTIRQSVTEKFDAITMLGVLGIFDDYEHVLANVLSWINPGGRLILHNMINDFDLDVFVKYRRSSMGDSTEAIEVGWNILSKASLRTACEKYDANLTECFPFQIGVDLAPSDDDPIRSWTEKDEFGYREIFNGLHIRQPQKLAVITKN